MGEAGEHDRLAVELSRQVRISATWAILIYQNIAAKAGLKVSDLLCLNVLSIQGPTTPGELAEMISITTGGGITAMIDRLEMAGFVQRRRDDIDRRRVIVQPTEHEAWSELRVRFGPLAEMRERIIDEYYVEQLLLLVDCMSHGNRMARELIARAGHYSAAP